MNFQWLEVVFDPTDDQNEHRAMKTLEAAVAAKGIVSIIRVRSAIIRWPSLRGHVDCVFYSELP